VSQVFNREGWRALRGSWLLLAGAIAVGSVIVYGSHWYGMKDKRDSADAARRLQEAHTRLAGARRERDSLNESADVFRTLVERGLLQREQRLDLVELVNALRSRYQLFTLDYEIAPQRPLVLAGGRVFPAIDVLASRVKLRAHALHEGDILGFIGELSRSRQGFYPVDRCTLRRVEGPAVTLQPHVEADCTLEWITLKDKRANHAG
jgi:hypothetical protein